MFRGEARWGRGLTAKTNNEGSFLIPSLTADEYIVLSSAPGFATVETKVTMLVGQTAEVDTIMPLKVANDSVVVREDADVVDTTSSSVAGNITPAVVANLLINDRNCMELATLVRGVRVDAIVKDTPLGGENSGRFQINLDGLQVTQNTADASFGQPRFSPDALRQFQIITDRFDANGVVTSPSYSLPQSTTSTATGVPVEWRPRSPQFLALVEF